MDSRLCGYYGRMTLPPDHHTDPGDRFVLANPVGDSVFVRRASVIVSFLLGIFLFREKHLRSKGACVAGIITGVILLA